MGREEIKLSLFKMTSSYMQKTKDFVEKKIPFGANKLAMI